MSFVAVIGTGALSVTVTKLRRDFARTREEMRALSVAVYADGEVQKGCEEASLAAHTAAREAAGAVPRMALGTGPVADSTATDPASLLASPEMKAAVDAMVTERIREEHRRQESARNQHYVRVLRDRMVAELGLGQADAERFTNVLTSLEDERQSLRDQSRSTGLALQESHLARLQDATDAAVREILGDEGLKKYQNLRASERGVSLVRIASAPQPR